ncbi:hypothetical protein TNCV_4370121 [Trichonephila clavipes]|nr:hypothetical protein TNCV_4370121 [Trichonephila clavipes]
MSQYLGSNLGEGMGVCKCIVPLRHVGTLNSRRTSREGWWKGKRWEAPEHLQGVLPQNWGGEVNVGFSGARANFGQAAPNTC